MNRILALIVFPLLLILSPGAEAQVVTLNVPQLATAGNAYGFEFTSMQFDVYLVGLGDPNGSSDYAANVLGNDRENYSYLFKPACGGGGKGGGHCVHPPPYQRTSGYTYSDTYQSVTEPPTKLDVFFHFSGADLAGLPLHYSVQDAGQYSYTLTSDTNHSVVNPDTPLSNGLYTLEYTTDSLQGSELVISAVPETHAGLLLAAGMAMVVGVRLLSAPRRDGAGNS